MKLLRVILIIIFTSVIFISCDDNDSGINDVGPIESTIDFKINRFPDIGSQETLFKIELTEFSETTNINLFKFRYDFDSDGTFDTDWLDSTKTQFYPTSISSQILTVEMQEPNGDFKTMKDTILIGNLEKRFTNSTGASMMETVWDPTSQYIYFTSAIENQYHQPYKGNISTGEIIKVPITPKYKTCTHFPKISPDGNKILWGHNKDGVFGLGILDVATGTINLILSFNTWEYEWGRNSNEILFISKDPTPEGGLMPRNLEMYKIDTDERVIVLPNSVWKDYISFKVKNENELYLIKVVRGTEPWSGKLYLEVMDINTTSVTQSWYFGETDDYLNKVMSMGLTISDDERWVFAGGSNILFDTQNAKAYSVNPLQYDDNRYWENSLSPDGTKIAVSTTYGNYRLPISYFELPAEIR